MKTIQNKSEQIKNKWKNVKAKVFWSVWYQLKDGGERVGSGQHRARKAGIAFLKPWIKSQRC